MSHGVHAVQHEVEHQIEHEEHGHGGGRKKSRRERQNKKIALLISVIALFLALAETLGKSSQTEGISLNIKASDSWNFFQAKTIRQTTLRTAAQAVTVEAAPADEARKATLLKQADDWMKTVARYESDPAEKDGRKELRALAENTSANAIPIWRAITTMNSRRRPFRSASCWHPRPSSPACSRSSMAQRSRRRRAGFMALGLFHPDAARAPPV